MLNVGCGVIVDDDCNKRGQTSGPVIRDEIHACRDRQENIFGCNCLLDCIPKRYNNVFFELPHNLTVYLYCSVNDIHIFLHEDFPHSPSSSDTSTI